MAITFDCSCGKQLKVADEFAGKRARCPACQSVVLVPEVGFEVVDEPPVKTAVARRANREEEEEDEEEDRRRRRRSRREEEEDEEEEDRRPRRKRLTDDGSARRRRKKRKAVESDNEHRSLEGKVANSGVAGGIVAMIIAVVWFVAGIIWADRIFFYPPILFVIGLVGVIKGLASGGTIKTPDGAGFRPIREGYFAGNALRTTVGIASARKVC